MLDGFQILLDRFSSGANLSVPVIAAIIRPFGLCYEVLTPHTVQKYFMPIVVRFLVFLQLKTKPSDLSNHYGVLLYVCVHMYIRHGQRHSWDCKEKWLLSKPNYVSGHSEQLYFIPPPPRPVTCNPV